jgi:hypothetical protein
MSQRNRRSRSEFLHRRSLRVMGSAAAAPGRSLPVGARMSFWPSISRRAPVNIGTVSSSRLQRRPRCAAFAAGPARRHTCGAMLPSPAPSEANKSDGRVGQQVEMSALIQRVPAPRSAVTRKITWPNPGSRCAVSPNAIHPGRGPRRTPRNIDRQPSLEVTSARQINQPRRPQAADPVKERSRSWNRLTLRSSCVSEPVGNALICRCQRGQRLRGSSRSLAALDASVSR